MRLTIQNFALTVLTPDDAASLVASGCGCEETGSFALADRPMSDVTWEGTIGVEGEMTGDGRLIEPNALRWENLPLPLRYAPEDLGGHGGAQVVGQILTIERQENGKLAATGDFDMTSELGPRAACAVKKGANGISMDLDSVSFEIRVARELLEDMPVTEEEAAEEKQEDLERPTDEDGRVTVIAINADDEVMVTTDARVRASTIVDIPAFIGATIDLTADSADPEAYEPSGSVALVAGGFPLDPPAAWFSDPQFNRPTPLTITEDGRVFGHLAIWGTCHTAYSGQCVEPPHSNSGYAYFRTGAILTAEGSEIPVGQITLDTMHAGRSLSPADTLAHYEHTGRGAADVAAGEDIYGIWIAGALRPGVTPAKVRTLRASPISGDWRKIGGNLELMAALSVNVQGFPVPRPQGLVASGGMFSLVAAGMLAPDHHEELVLSDEDIMYLKKLASRERQQIQTQAEEIAARVRSTRASVLARRIGVE
jgi:hypothetical protein